MSVACKNCRTFYKPYKEYTYHCNDCLRDGKITCPYCAFQSTDENFEVCGSCKNVYQCKKCDEEYKKNDCHDCECKSTVIWVSPENTYVVEIPAE